LPTTTIALIVGLSFAGFVVGWTFWRSSPDAVLDAHPLNQRVSQINNIAPQAELIKPEELRARVDKFYAAWQQSDAKGLWQLRSDLSRADDSLAAYAERINSLAKETKIRAFTVKDIVPIHSDKAIVFTQMEVSTVGPDKPEDFVTIDRTEWVLNKDGWFHAADVPAPTHELPAAAAH
jgi:hypothetical protein